MFDPYETEQDLQLLFVHGPLDGKTIMTRGRCMPAAWSVPIMPPTIVTSFDPDYDPSPISACVFEYRKHIIRSQNGLRSVDVYLPDSIEKGDVMMAMRLTRSGRRVLEELE